MAGPAINLAAATLRSSAIELYGQGGGSIPRGVMQKIPTEILPKMIELAASGKIRIDKEPVPLADIAKCGNVRICMEEG
jgi:hypothetical protein